MTQTEHRAQELLDLWDAIKTSRSCIHVVDIQQHKDKLNNLANMIRLGLYAEYLPDSLDVVCDEFELEYIKVRNKIYHDLIETLQTK